MPLAGCSTLECNGEFELVVQGYGIVELVFAGEDVTSRAERVGGMS
jgi:hypothetical protein